MGNNRPKVLDLAERCCGCGACASVCPKHCIEMIPDDFGFTYPNVDVDRCVSCGACERACTALSFQSPDVTIEALWALATDDGLRMRSSSGGLFGVFALDALRRGGSVYGAAFIDGFRAVRHVRVADESALDGIMRSKYVQSVIGPDVYSSLDADLRKGIPVLFAGTACQVRGIKGYLATRRAPIDTLVCIDVICHGVPSPELWRRWLDWKANGSELDVNFRNKKTGWETYSVSYGPGMIASSGEDWYMKAFLGNASLRASCLDCPAKRSSGSDITLGDFWGVQAYHREAYDERGTSAVLINSKVGRKAFERIAGAIVYGPSSVDKVAAGNPSLVFSVVPYPKREAFLADVAKGLSIPELMQSWSFSSSFAQRLSSFVRVIRHKTQGAIAHKSSLP